ncbi:hypothetical protein Csa_003916 [Cucumis sativus]|nr:hypothetical protein Csa_003916 [Cucumis sativus]
MSKNVGEYGQRKQLRSQIMSGVLFKEMQSGQIKSTRTCNSCPNTHQKTYPPHSSTQHST